MKKLPLGWALGRLETLCDFVMGQAPPGKASNFSGIGTPFVKAGEFGAERPLIREWTTQPLKTALSTDVLICVVGATAGKLNLGSDCAIGRSVAAIRPQPGFSQLYLYRFLQSIMLDMRAQSVGSAQGVISKEMLGRLEVPLPPEAEQRRIVAKLDSLFARTRSAREELARIPCLIEHYKQAILAAAFRAAEETAERSVQLGELTLEARNGLSKKPTDTPPGTPILRISAVRPMVVDLRDRRYYPLTEDVPERARLTNGDLLFTRYNGNPEFVAVCGKVEGLSEALTYPDKLIRVRLVDDVLSSFVELICSAPQARDALRRFIKTAAGQHGISGKDLKRLQVPVPPLKIQLKICETGRVQLAAIAGLNGQYGAAARLLDHLDQATLAKAFRGELVPRDPSDEPAAKLLERIRAARAAEPKQKRRGRTVAAD